MFSVTPIPAFSDNYIWVIASPDSNMVAVVDPGDEAPVLAYLEENNLQLTAILITHHHNDHTGGVEALKDRFKTPVYGPANSPFQGITHPLNDGDSIQLMGASVAIKAIPGHTLDHISYYSERHKPQLFCGDTLFLAGCGRLFEGTAKQMLNAMNYFASLPDDTEVYCTHEYSMANLSFAEAVEPNNDAIKNAIRRCAEQREQDQPTLPTSIAEEKLINPFMRTQHEDVVSAALGFSRASLSNEVEVFASIREWKNQF